MYQHKYILKKLNFTASWILKTALDDQERDLIERQQGMSDKDPAERFHLMLAGRL